MGSLLPYLSVWLSAQGMSDAQIGWIISTTGIGVISSPWIVAVLADTHLQPRRLIALLMLGCGVGCICMLLGDGFTWYLLSHLLFSLCLAPILPLQDGLLFEVQQHQTQAGQERTSYHRVRVYGTVGFILPSLGLFVILWIGWSLDWVLITCLLFSIVGAFNALGLPHFSRPNQGAQDNPADPAEQSTQKTGLRDLSQPTLEALRRLLNREALVFALGMWLLIFTISIYYTFYPVLLAREPDQGGMGIDPAWLGLIANLGVLVEVPFMLAFGWLLKNMGLRWFMVWGAAFMAARMALLWLMPNVWTGVGTQIFHGMMVLVTHVAPPVYFNHLAHHQRRHTTQGLYVVLVVGTARIAGNIAGGQISEINLAYAFMLITILCMIAAVLFALAFRPKVDPHALA